MYQMWALMRAMSVRIHTVILVRYLDNGAEEGKGDGFLVIYW